MSNCDADPEAAIPPGQSAIPYWRLIIDQAVVTPRIVNHAYEGSGTDKDPYLVTWIEDDPRDPMRFPVARKWLYTMLVAVVTLAAAFVSSAYSGTVNQMMADFDASEELVLGGLALYVLGFAVGPMAWAPLSELYGRQVILFISFGCFSAFNAGAAASQNIQSLLILRFFAGASGASPLTNSGGVIADLFPTSQRGLAMGFFSTAPFLGPSIGPIVGGFLGQSKGWRWVQGLSAIFAGVLWILTALVLPETYPTILLRKRAHKLSQMSGKVYRSKSEAFQGAKTAKELFKESILRPWVLLIFEPIVLLLSIYMSIIYGTLYMLFAAYPVVYEEQRGWNEGVGSLPFLGIAIGMVFAVSYNIPDNARFARKENAPPESRLPGAMVGGVAIPIGLFWFAWTNSPSIFWLSSVVAGGVFGFGMVLIFIAIKNYLVDAYTIYAASALAATVILRSFFGAAFPLFTTYMFQNLGIHWASSVPAFLALGCTPLPFCFYHFGASIRKRCKYAAQAEEYLRRVREQSSKEQQQQTQRYDNPLEGTTNLGEEK
ncbi:MAG: hypothetical protein M1818_004048 [Claussenomyces sp. TS43310]|nr:MAG: hypothetical protein M1818_004048 [Claussenomyces sp. TS43310]